LKEISDNEASELFNHLLNKKIDVSDENLPTINRIPKEEMYSQYDRLEVMTLETHFEKWFREEDSL
jgi:hypothetical protein